MRIDGIRGRLGSPDVRRVVLALEYPPESREAKTDEIVASYATHEDWVLDGAWVGDELAGAIGLARTGPDTAEIRHIAVLPDHRRRGIGTELVRYVITRYALRELRAETDVHGVGFYRRCGFTVRSLGEKYPGVERFWCTLQKPVPTGS